MKLEMITHIATSEAMSLPTSRILPSRADHGTRTRNPRITSAVRYQLRQVGNALKPNGFAFRCLGRWGAKQSPCDLMDWLSKYWLSQQFLLGRREFFFGEVALFLHGDQLGERLSVRGSYLNNWCRSL